MQKQNHKEENLLALHQESLLLKGIGSIFNRGTIPSLNTRYRRKSCIVFVIQNKCSGEKRERFISGKWRKILRINSHNRCFGLTVDGKHVWRQQEEEQKGDFSNALVIREEFSTSELLKEIQDAILLILHYRTMLLFRATSSNMFNTFDMCSICILSTTVD